MKLVTYFIPSYHNKHVRDKDKTGKKTSQIPPCDILRKLVKKKDIHLTPVLHSRKVENKQNQHNELHNLENKCMPLFEDASV